MSTSLNIISLDTIKRAKNLTLSQKAVLGEIHSLASRGKEFYAWNSYLQEKLGIGRSTVANALTFFYKEGILKSICERRDGKTARITKRTVNVNYKKLSTFLDAPTKSQTYVKQPITPQTKEQPFIVPYDFDNIDFTLPEKQVFKQWADFMISQLDVKTNIANPATRERKQLQGILDDARRVINSSHKNNNACSATKLMEDRRVENAIFYCMDRLIKYEEEDTFYESVDEGREFSTKLISKGDLSFTFMRNIYKPWTALLTKALSHDTFDPKENVKDDDWYVYHDYSGLTNDEHEEIDKILGGSLPDKEDVTKKLREISNLYPTIMEQDPENVRIRKGVMAMFRELNWVVLDDYHEQMKQKAQSETIEGEVISNNHVNHQL